MANVCRGLQTTTARPQVVNSSQFCQKLWCRRRFQIAPSAPRERTGHNMIGTTFLNFKVEVRFAELAWSPTESSFACA
jgi:hypothetical protein